MTRVARLDPASGEWTITGDPDPRHPREAPRFECAFCGKATVKHYGGIGPAILLEDRRVICHRCRWSKPAHDKLFPECPERWHDPLEHSDGMGGTNAAIATILGIWRGHGGDLT